MPILECQKCPFDEWLWRAFGARTEWPKPLDQSTSTRRGTPASEGSMAHVGTLKRFVEGKGFGFIENSDGSGDVFVHFSQLTNGGSDDMIVGAEMSFDITEDPRSGKTKATNVTLTNGGSGERLAGMSYGGGKGKGKGKRDRYDPY